MGPRLIPHSQGEAHPTAQVPPLVKGKSGPLLTRVEEMTKWRQPAVLMGECQGRGSHSELPLRTPPYHTKELHQN